LHKPFGRAIKASNNHQKPTFHPLGDFLNPALASARTRFKKSPIGQKLDFANHPYLCKEKTPKKKLNYHQPTYCISLLVGQ
jgi:hypothetical protein